MEMQVCVTNNTESMYLFGTSSALNPSFRFSRGGSRLIFRRLFGFTTSSYRVASRSWYAFARLAGTRRRPTGYPLSLLSWALGDA
jgi:hypothetical protein